MAELADALDLGSSVPDVQVQVLLPAPNSKAELSLDRRQFGFIIFKYSYHASLYL